MITAINMTFIELTVHLPYTAIGRCQPRLCFFGGFVAELNGIDWTPTVDGWNPAPVDRQFIPLFAGFHTSLVVQDFSHQQYHLSSIMCHGDTGSCLGDKSLTNMALWLASNPLFSYHLSFVMYSYQRRACFFKYNPTSIHCCNPKSSNHTMWRRKKHFL